MISKTLEQMVQRALWRSSRQTVGMIAEAVASSAAKANARAADYRQRRDEAETIEDVYRLALREATETGAACMAESINEVLRGMIDSPGPPDNVVAFDAKRTRS